MKYREMTKNYIFRELKCGLSIKQTSELCFKSVRTVKEWDKGKEIPKECKRLNVQRVHGAANWEECNTTTSSCGNCLARNSIRVGNQDDLKVT